MRFHPCRLPHLILSGPFLLPQSLISLFCIMQHFQDKLCNVLTFAGLVGVIVWGTVSLWPEVEATPLLQPEAEELSAADNSSPHRGFVGHGFSSRAFPFSTKNGVSRSKLTSCCPGILFPSNRYVLFRLFRFLKQK